MIFKNKEERKQENKKERKQEKTANKRKRKYPKETKRGRRRDALLLNVYYYHS